jgi:SAM-dependent methyltransferase
VRSIAVAVALSCVSCVSTEKTPTTVTPQAATVPATSATLLQFQQEAFELRSLYPDSNAVARFLDGVKKLPRRTARVINVNGKPRTINEDDYYQGRWGSPLAYAQTMAVAERAGATFLPGTRVLDFGFGAPAHLQLWSLMGINAVGVDVDDAGKQLYADKSDTAMPPGTVSWVYGRFPTDPATTAAVGDGYDLIVSKNTLKKGYVHPSRPADPKTQLNIGVDDATFLSALHHALKPGGLVVIWNLCPKRAELNEEYVPWAEGENPYTAQQWQDAGFEVLSFDVDDSRATRAMLHAMDFDAPQDEGSVADLERDFFAWFTVAKRPVPTSVP